MKKIIFFLLTMTFAFSASAQQSRLQLRAQSREDIIKSADDLRSQKKQIRDLFMQLAVRKAQTDIIAIMNKNRMSQEEMTKVLESDGLKKYLSDLAQDPKMQNRAEQHLTRLMMPGVIEAHVMKQREQIAEEMRQKVILARATLHKSQNFLNKEQVLDPEDDETLISKVWDHLVEDLYKK